MKQKIIIIILVLLLSSIYFLHWTHCLLDERFFYSALDTKLRVIFDIRSDQTTLPLVAKLFHNKVVQGSVDIFNAYIAFWDIRFLLFLLSPLTVFGVFARFFYLIKDKKKMKLLEIIAGIIFLLSPFLVLFHLIKDQTLGLSIFSLPFVFFSLHGLFLFVRKQKYAWIIIFMLLTFSLWLLFALPTFIIDFCHG